MKLNCNTQFRYTPDPGEVAINEEVYCGVCSDKMIERRGCVGPRGFAQAIAGGKSLYDEFVCPNHDEKWHEQVVSLRREINKTASSVVASLMESEVELILENRQETK